MYCSSRVPTYISKSHRYMQLFSPSKINRRIQGCIQKMDLGGAHTKFSRFKGAVSNAILYNNILLFNSRGAVVFLGGVAKAPPQMQP